MARKQAQASGLEGKELAKHQHKLLIAVGKQRAQQCAFSDPIDLIIRIQRSPTLIFCSSPIHSVNADGAFKASICVTSQSLLYHGFAQNNFVYLHCRFGWHDSYTYSKALAELAAVRAAEEYGIPMLILRPTIVESAMREPEP